MIRHRAVLGFEAGASAPRTRLTWDLDSFWTDELKRNITGLLGDVEPDICPVNGYFRGSQQVLGGSNWLSQNSGTISIQAMKSTPAPSG
jgi:hypothetical protein